MIKYFECVDSFSVDKYDADGFITDEITHIDNGEIFECDLEDKERIFGNWNDTLKLVNEYHWLELTRETIRRHFVELDDMREKVE